MTKDVPYSALFFILLSPAFFPAQSKPAADQIITNAKIWTVDQSCPTAGAVAVLGDRITAAGSNQDVDGWRGPKTQAVDADGKLLLPGSSDAHVHFVCGGRQLDSIQLNDATSSQGICPPHRRAGQGHCEGRMDSGRQLELNQEVSM